jgi:hypothetical protein
MAWRLTDELFVFEKLHPLVTYVVDQKIGDRSQTVPPSARGKLQGATPVFIAE